MGVLGVGVLGRSRDVARQSGAPPHLRRFHLRFHFPPPVRRPLAPRRARRRIHANYAKLCQTQNVRPMRCDRDVACRPERRRHFHLCSLPVSHAPLPARLVERTWAHYLKRLHDGGAQQQPDLGLVHQVLNVKVTDLDDVDRLYANRAEYLNSVASQRLCPDARRGGHLAVQVAARTCDRITASNAVRSRARLARCPRDRSRTC